MKLSRIIAYRESLNELPFHDAADDLQHDVHVCLDTLQQSPLDLGAQMDIIDQVRDSLQRDLDNFQGSLDLIKRNIDQEINKRSQEYFATSYRDYESIQNEPIYQLMHRELRRDHEGEKLLRHRIKINSNWKYPGLLIRTQKEDFFTDMVDSDPLYIYDTHHALLEPCLASVTENYRARLRIGIIDESHDVLFPKLPISQMGLVVVWNFFNYRPIEVLKRYLEACYLALRPGGTLIFTYNNCSRSLPVILCEHAFASFTPDWAVKALLSNIGFEMVNQYDCNYHLNFIEVRKPGRLHSLRGGQTLAVIKAKPYTRARMQQLREMAVESGIQVPPGEIDYKALEDQISQALESKKQAESLEQERQKIQEELQAAQTGQALQSLAVDLETQIAQARELRRQNKENERQEQQRVFKEQMLEKLIRQREHEKSVRTKADDLNIPDRDIMPFDQLQEAVEHIEHMTALNQLRKEAVRLKLDRTDLIMRKYTLKELKRAIKKWRAENERPPT